MEGRSKSPMLQWDLEREMDCESCSSSETLTREDKGRVRGIRRQASKTVAYITH